MIVVLIGFVNFFAFFADTQRIGGDALNGHRQDGRFYVSEHGLDTEVDAATWYRSRLHAMSVFVTHPLAMLAMAYLLFTFVFPAFMKSGMPVDAGVGQRVLESGAPAASTSCGGRVGSVWFSGPLLNAVVYPGGLWVKPLFMPPLAIPRESIADVRLTRLMFTKAVEVTTHGAAAGSSLMLYCTGNAHFMEALRKLTGVPGPADPTSTST